MAAGGGEGNEHPPCPRRRRLRGGGQGPRLDPKRLRHARATQMSYKAKRASRVEGDIALRGHRRIADDDQSIPLRTCDAAHPCGRARGRRATVREVPCLGGKRAKRSSTATDDFVAATIAADAVPTTCTGTLVDRNLLPRTTSTGLEAAPPTTLRVASTTSPDLVATTRTVAIASARAARRSCPRASSTWGTPGMTRAPPRSALGTRPTRVAARRRHTTARRPLYLAESPRNGLGVSSV